MRGALADDRPDASDRIGPPADRADHGVRWRDGVRRRDGNRRRGDDRGGASAAEPVEGRRAGARSRRCRPTSAAGQVAQHRGTSRRGPASDQAFGSLELADEWCPQVIPGIGRCSWPTAGSLIRCRTPPRSSSRSRRSSPISPRRASHSGISPPALADAEALAAVADALVAPFAGRFDAVAGIEARGFAFAAAAAARGGYGLVLIRKAGKLPGATLTESYALEYGHATLEVHPDQVAPGTRLLLVDDVPRDRRHRRGRGAARRARGMDGGRVRRRARAPRPRRPRPPGGHRDPRPHGRVAPTSPPFSGWRHSKYIGMCCLIRGFPDERVIVIPWTPRSS